MADRGIMEISLKAGLLLEDGFTSGQQCIYCILRLPAYIMPHEMDFIDICGMSDMYEREECLVSVSIKEWKLGRKRCA